MLTARICSATDTQELRRSVLRPGFAPGQPLPGDEVAGVSYLGVFDERGRAVSACLVFAETCPFETMSGLDPTTAWRLRGMATDPNRRGAGAGGSVLRLAYHVAVQDDAELIWCQAREPAVGFYEGDGWRTVGGSYLAAGIGHLDMWRPITAADRIV